MDEEDKASGGVVVENERNEERKLVSNETRKR